MEDSIREALTRVGVNIEEAIERFGSNELLLMFLGKFSEDPSYESFRAAMEENRYEDAFKAAHALKGVCGNLSIVPLFKIVSMEVEFLRSKDYQEAVNFYPQIVQEYERVMQELKNI